MLLYELKFLVPNYICLQNPCLGGLRPPDPRSVCPLPSTEFVEPPPPEKNFCLRHCIYEKFLPDNRPLQQAANSPTTVHYHTTLYTAITLSHDTVQCTHTIIWHCTLHSHYHTTLYTALTLSLDTVHCTHTVTWHCTLHSHCHLALYTALTLSHDTVHCTHTVTWHCTLHSHWHMTLYTALTLSLGTVHCTHTVTWHCTLHSHCHMTLYTALTL